MLVKLWGLPRSASNYLKALLERNYYIYAAQNCSGWKHGFFQWASTNNILVAKRPLPWLHSMWKYTQQKTDLGLPHGMNFQQWLRSPLLIAVNKTSYRNPIVYWNKMIEHWLDIPELKIITYKELVQDPEAVLNNYFQEFRINRNFDFCTKIWNPSAEQLNEGTQDHDNTKYLQNLYLQHYAQVDIEWVQRELDHGIYQKVFRKLD